MALRTLILTAGVAASAPAWSQMPSTVDVKLDHDAGANVIHISLRANDASFNGLVSNVVFTIRWPESSPASLGVGASAWCPLPSQAFPVSPTTMVIPGNGFKYRTYFSVGLALLGDLVDDGGCEQSLVQDDWVEVYAIPVNGDPGSTYFEIAEDQYVIDENRGYFVSLGGIAHTGSIFNFSTAGVEVERRLDGIVAMPNPADKEARITLKGGYSGAWVAEVHDAGGREALRIHGQGDNILVPCAQLHVGAYVVRITAAEGVSTVQLIVSR